MVKGKYTPLAKKHPESGKWCAKRIRSPKEFDPRFGFRTTHPPGRTDVEFTIGCLKGRYHPRAKGRKCEGTTVQRVLKLKVRGRCPRSR